MSNNNIVGNKIKYFRNKKGITQKKLADLIGKTESSIQKYECGSTEVPFSVLEKIAESLDTELLFLLDDEYLESASAYFMNNEDTKLSYLLHDMALLNKQLSANIENGYIQSFNILFSKLNDSGKQKALERILELTEIPRYIKPDMPDAYNNDVYTRTTRDSEQELYNTAENKTSEPYYSQELGKITRPQT